MKTSSYDLGKAKHEKCLECDFTPCVNFYRSTRKLEGGEIRVFEEMVKTKLHLPCEVGGLIYSLCKLSIPLGIFFSYPLYLQCIRDLKASAFLLLCGHYRASMQILRPVVENYLTGIYFDSKFILAQDESERNKTEEDYKKFLDGMYEIPEGEWQKIRRLEERRKKRLDYDFLLRWMVDRKLITGRGEDKLRKRIGLLNKYVHPHFQYTEIAKPYCPGCPAFVCYNEEEYRQCIQLFQDVVTDLLRAFYAYVDTFSPEKLRGKEIDEALGYLKVLEVTEKDVGKQIIFSKELRKFISTLPPLEPSTVQGESNREHK